MTNIIFQINLIAHYMLLGAIIFSIIQPKNRIWPSPKQQSWRFYGYWVLFYLSLGLTIFLTFLTWNSWIISPKISFFIGIPLAMLGGSFSIWGIYSLGIVNTHGIKDGFIEFGAYQFTRNPQYLGDIVLIIGLLLIANSIYVAVFLLLEIMMFTIMPFSEEPLLKEQYGDEYIKYKNRTSRFL
jgi:protein-S-isoprenylcysteine O-methyltransferase Ste14